MDERTLDDSPPVSPQPQAKKIVPPRCIHCDKYQSQHFEGKYCYHDQDGYSAEPVFQANPLPGREAQEESRTIVGLADDLAEALYTVIAAIPKQTEDADWWQDDLSTAVREANKLLAEYTAFPDAPQLPVRPQAVKPIRGH